MITKQQMYLHRIALLLGGVCLHLCLNLWTFTAGHSRYINSSLNLHVHTSGFSCGCVLGSGTL